LNPDELAKEIARRQQVARDLKLRELVWNLYGSHLQYHSRDTERERGLTHPILEQTLTIEDNRYSFPVGNERYTIAYSEEKKETSGRGDDETITTPVQLSIEVGCRLVFEFKMTRSVTCAEDAPRFREDIGDVTAFIEGPWVREFSAFVQEVDQYRRDRSPK
jgi:hypothetical protein